MQTPIILCLAGAIVLGAWNPSAAASTSLDGRIAAAVAAHHDDLVDLRHDLHRHPELSGQEERTAAVVTKRMEALGLEVHTGVGGHGVVAVLRGAKDGPVVAYRADMDAMPSDVPDPSGLASETPGVRHICGHDVHTTVAVGIAEALASVRDELPGAVVFIFQPSEENAQGAKAVIDDGALNDPAPEAIFGLHCAPLEVGQIAGGAGLLMGGVDVITLTLAGDGDLAKAARVYGQCVSSVHGMTPELDEPEGPGGFTEAVVVESKAGPGEAQWTLRAMVRASSKARHAAARASVEKGFDAVDEAGIKVESLEYTEDAVPPVVNDAKLVEEALGTLRSLLGDSSVVVIDEPTPNFSEDFSRYQQRIPGAFFFLGVSNSAKGILGLPHHPMFAVDEDAIGVGARAMAAVLVDYLTR